MEECSMNNNEKLLPYDREAYELTTLLREIYDNKKDMVIGILALVIDYEEDVNALLRYIKEGNNSWAAVHKYALSLYDKRDHDEEF